MRMVNLSLPRLRSLESEILEIRHLNEIGHEMSTYDTQGIVRIGVVSRRELREELINKDDTRQYSRATHGERVRIRHVRTSSSIGHRATIGCDDIREIVAI